MDLSQWAQLFTTLDQLPMILEEFETNAMAGDIETIRSQFADLRDAQASGNQAAISAAMDALVPSIVGLERTETVLRTIGRDPNAIIPADSERR
jgi:hypothetical protein